MDFYEVRTRTTKKGTIEVYPEFLVRRHKDLMVQGGKFYAIWDQQTGLWTKDEYFVAEVIDRDLYKCADALRETTEDTVVVKSLRDFQNHTWKNFVSYVNSLPDYFRSFDDTLLFSNDVAKLEDYATKKLPYIFGGTDISSYNELMSTLYDPEEREKIEWAIGAIFAGDSKKIQKFIVLYGEAGSGKSTVLNIIQQLFSGYYKNFEAKAIGQENNQFSLATFKDNPLVAIQHDGDLSRIEDNTKLNSLISHEEMLVNEKYKTAYSMRLDTFLFMATNKPVKITDTKSGMLRRLIDVSPSNRKLPFSVYSSMMNQIPFELGGIAEHCLNVYNSLGRSYFDSYRPLHMMEITNHLMDFVIENYHIFKNEDHITLKRAWTMYQNYISESNMQYSLNKMQFKTEFAVYFSNYGERSKENGYAKNTFSGFREELLTSYVTPIGSQSPSLVLEHTSSILDDILKECPAQYANEQGTPNNRWDTVSTVLADISTDKLHYVQVPVNHIVVDFDLRNANNEKDKNLNLEEASHFPKTYAEFSQGGNGVHLHYIYDGDVDELAPLYKEGVEIKVYRGNSSLRRRLTYCNNEPIAHISSGLPKKEKKMDFENFKNEKSIRTFIEKNLHKVYHPATKPSVEFIKKGLDEAYSSGMDYDVSDLLPSVTKFAAGSTNQSATCLKLVSKMKFKSEQEPVEQQETDTSPIAFYDVEVFPNLFLLSYKLRHELEATTMVNPTPEDVTTFVKLYRLIGFNNRRYDNHILYGRMLGRTEEELYHLSKSIINGEPNATFPGAYGLSYTDIYDFSSKKQSLKKFEIELGLHHKELGYSWDEPVPEDKWKEVARYCENDVLATEAVFKARKADFDARKILARISGLSVNDTTQKHTARIIFGANTNNTAFNVPDLSELFPGYKFDSGVSTYRGETIGEGGYVYSEPGCYRNVALLDVASMHPTSIIAMNLFGDKTDNYKQLLDARVHIKRGEFEKVKGTLNGALDDFLADPRDATDLAYALKIALNIVYGLTAASFSNPFSSPLNKDNVVAKRGALFMAELKHELQKRGYTVAHIKTDSVKIPEADEEVIQFVKDFGAKYGYEFEHEATYERMCLVNDAVYIAYEENHGWTATGAQFKHPYVFKTLFSGEETSKADLAETKEVKTSIFLDMNENLGEDEHNYIFVGKVGSFLPVLPGEHGGILLREQNGNMHAVVGTKGYRWLETETVLNRPGCKVDFSYGQKLVDEAVKTLSKYTDVEEFCRGSR